MELAQALGAGDSFLPTSDVRARLGLKAPA